MKHVLKLKKYYGATAITLEKIYEVSNEPGATRS